jgi:hypothetical protein
MADLDFNTVGIFASDDDLHAKEVTLGGEKHVVYVRKLPAFELRRYHEESTSEDIEVRLQAGFRILAKCIRREDGKAHMTLESAKRLKPAPVREFMRVFVEVNAKPDAEESGND